MSAFTCTRCRDWGYRVEYREHGPAQRVACECGQPARTRGLDHEKRGKA